MKRSIKRGRGLWTRRGFLGLLGVLMSAHRLVWGNSLETKPKLSLHEADYYQTFGEDNKRPEVPKD